MGHTLTLLTHCLFPRQLCGPVCDWWLFEQKALCSLSVCVDAPLLTNCKPGAEAEAARVFNPSNFIQVSVKRDRYKSLSLCLLFKLNSFPGHKWAGEDHDDWWWWRLMMNFIAFIIFTDLLLKRCYCDAWHVEMIMQTLAITAIQ